MEGISYGNERDCCEQPGWPARSSGHLGVLSLGIVKGTAITLIADGPDEEEAVNALVELINSDFSE